MKKMFKTMAFVAAAATSVGLASCAKEDTATAVTADALPKATVIGYVEALTDSLKTDKYPDVRQYAKAGLTVVVTMYNSDLGISSSGMWTASTTTDADGKYTIEVPMSATESSTNVYKIEVAPFVAAYTNTKSPEKQYIFKTYTWASATLYKGIKEAYASDNIVCTKDRVPNE